MKVREWNLVVGLGMGMFAFPLWAGEQDFELINQTGDPLESLYVSPSDSNEWDEDVLGQDILNDGESANIHFSRQDTACKWDIKVRYPDGEEPIWYGINLCDVSSVTLQWNEERQETFATVR